MDSKKIDALLEKYWVGETTREEENAIKAFLGDEAKSRYSEEEISYFDLLRAYERIELSPQFDDDVLQQITQSRSKYRMMPWLKLAASIVLLLGATLFIYQQYQDRLAHQAELAQAREAFELTKQALFLVSSELNRGASFTKELGDFDLTVEKIKNNEVSIELHN